MPDEEVPEGPLEVVICDDCELVQLKHTFDLEEMFGDTYGYRSSLNKSMVDHLTEKAARLESQLSDGDTVLDIGSNDGTFLKALKKKLFRIGFDPVAKFADEYPDEIEFQPKFFSEAAYRRAWRAPPKLITSIAMFYDLDDPVSFARGVLFTLDPGGIWHLEQSYFPHAFYDMINHEHIEYYSLHSIANIIDRAGGRIVRVDWNDTNGGSFELDVMKGKGHAPVVLEKLAEEEPIRRRHAGQFKISAHRHRSDLLALVNKLNNEGKTVWGYGASTKGNAVLQYCGFSPREIPKIVEVNPEKFGRVTPGSGIPIVPEGDGIPDYFLVLPWHFREGILKNNPGQKFIFPFPKVEIVG